MPQAIAVSAVRAVARRGAARTSECRNAVSATVTYDVITRTLSNARRKDLVLALSKRDTPIAAKDVRLLNAGLAEAYRDKTLRTIERDLHELVASGLVIDGDGSFRANKELIEAFLPRKADPSLANAKVAPELLTTS